MYTRIDLSRPELVQKSYFYRQLKSQGGANLRTPRHTGTGTSTGMYSCSTIHIDPATRTTTGHVLYNELIIQFKFNDHKCPVVLPYYLSTGHL